MEVALIAYDARLLCVGVAVPSPLNQHQFCPTIPQVHMLPLGLPQVYPRATESSLESGPRFFQWMHSQTAGSSSLSSPNFLHLFSSSIFHYWWPQGIWPPLCQGQLHSWILSLTISLIFLILVKRTTSVFSGFTGSPLDLLQVSIFVGPLRISSATWSSRV